MGADLILKEMRVFAQLLEEHDFHIERGLWAAQLAKEARFALVSR